MLLLEPDDGGAAGDDCVGVTAKPAEFVVVV
jgi:hypothetical protein